MSERNLKEENERTMDIFFSITFVVLMEIGLFFCSIVVAFIPIIGIFFTLAGFILMIGFPFIAYAKYKENPKWYMMQKEVKKE